jgi:hypothetical protein
MVVMVGTVVIIIVIVVVIVVMVMVIAIAVLVDQKFAVAGVFSILSVVRVWRQAG